MTNEFYARDSSRKIQAIFKSRMEKGLRCSGSVPYGYRRDPKDKQHLSWSGGTVTGILDNKVYLGHMERR